MSLKPILFVIFTILPTLSFLGKNERKSIKEKEVKLNSYVSIYHQLEDNGEELPAMETFKKAYSGYLTFREKGVLSKELLTIIDFGLSSNKKRLWVIDLENKSILFHTLVAHGKNSGREYARAFSNISQSHQSSLGFYVTGKTYYGKHGLSLYLHGKEEGINDKARQRYIVMHGADYVSQKFIRQYGRLGRSYGCPAVPMTLYKPIIQKIKEKSCLFMYYPSDEYEKKSALLGLNVQ